VLGVQIFIWYIGNFFAYIWYIFSEDFIDFAPTYFLYCKAWPEKS